MRVKIFCVLFLILLATSVFAGDGPLYIYNAICEKDGSLALTFSRETGEKIYAEDVNVKVEYIGDLVVTNSKFDVLGEWNNDFIRESGEKTSLTTEEAVFNLSGEYRLLVNYDYNNELYTTNYKTRCPGFKFSCKLLGVYVDYCKNINNEKFEASVRIYGLGDVTNENLSLINNIQFKLQAEKDYEDYKGKISDKGSLPKNVKINNSQYSQYYFSVNNFDNKIKNFVAKIVGINYIKGGCVDYPDISLYSYKECEDIMIQEKEVKISKEKNMTKQKQEKSEQVYIGHVVKNQDIVKKLKGSVGTKKVKENKWHLILLFIIFGLSIMGVIYIMVKRNFNKEHNF